MEGPGPLCLGCADLDHLVFLAAGDAALTRRAKKASGLSAVVVRFSRSRRRYERQGVLVEEQALEQAEEACLADDDARRRRRIREEARRAEHDVEFQADFAGAITELFPGCPPERAEEIARHAGDREHRVEVIVGDDWGGASVGFTGGLVLDVLPVTTASEECWRYFRPGDDDDHFVVFEPPEAP